MIPLVSGLKSKDVTKPVTAKERVTPIFPKRFARPYASDDKQ